MPESGDKPKHGTGYTIAFAAVVCLVCSVLVTGTTALLRDRQEANRLLDQRRNVLIAAGLAAAGDRLGESRVEELFARVEAVVLDLEQDRVVDLSAQELRARGQAMRPAPNNDAGLQQIPRRQIIYRIRDGDDVDRVVLPIVGKGLWSTMYGFLCMDADGVTIRGVAFYRHGETPGLGGEIENPRWAARWEGKQAFSDNGDPAFQLVKGDPGPTEVAALSGATLTSKGVTELMRFWLGEHGYGPYLAHLGSDQTPADDRDGR